MPNWRNLVLDIIKLTNTVKFLNERTEKESTQTHEIDKRIVRLKTLVEVAKYNRITEQRRVSQEIQTVNTKKDILFAAIKIKNQLVYNMAKAEGNTHTIAEVTTVIEGVTVGGKNYKSNNRLSRLIKHGNT